MLLKSLEGTREQMEYYYNRLQQNKDNELLKFMYESYQRQYLAELDTYKALKGGEQ